MKSLCRGGNLIHRHVYGHQPTLIYVTGLGNEGYVCASSVGAFVARRLCKFPDLGALAPSPRYKMRIINFKNIVLQAISSIKKLVEAYNGLYRRHALLRTIYTLLIVASGPTSYISSVFIINPWI